MQGFCLLTTLGTPRAVCLQEVPKREHREIVYASVYSYSYLSTITITTTVSHCRSLDYFESGGLDSAVDADIEDI